MKNTGMFESESFCYDKADSAAELLDTLEAIIAKGYFPQVLPHTTLAGKTEFHLIGIRFKQITEKAKQAIDSLSLRGY